MKRFMAAQLVLFFALTAVNANARSVGTGDSGGGLDSMSVSAEEFVAIAQSKVVQAKLRGLGAEQLDSISLDKDYHNGFNSKYWVSGNKCTFDVVVSYKESQPSEGFPSYPIIDGVVLGTETVCRH